MAAGVGNADEIDDPAAVPFLVDQLSGQQDEEVIESGAAVDAKSDTDLMTPLVSGEPRAQPRSPGGMTALMFASREGCLDCVAAAREDLRRLYAIVDEA